MRTVVRGVVSVVASYGLVAWRPRRRHNDSSMAVEVNTNWVRADQTEPRVVAVAHWSGGATRRVYAQVGTSPTLDACV
jgi:hypothetical protein